MICFREMKLQDLELCQKWLATPHVAKWYEHPADWVEEVKKQDAEFHWIHHHIVVCDGKDMGFCQYYACTDSDELWEGSGGTDQGTLGCQTCCGSARAGKSGVMRSFAGLWLCI